MVIITVVFRHRPMETFNKITDALEKIMFGDARNMIIDSREYLIVYPGMNYSAGASENKTQTSEAVNFKLDRMKMDRTQINFILRDNETSWAKYYSKYRNFMLNESMNCISASAGGQVTTADYNCEQQQKIIDFCSRIIHKFIRKENDFIHPELKNKLKSFLGEIAKTVFIPHSLTSQMTHVARIRRIYTIDQIVLNQIQT